MPKLISEERFRWIKPILDKEITIEKMANIAPFMGIDDHNTDFKRVFNQMGLFDKWILTPNETHQEILSDFLLFSQSAVRASQSAANFSQAAMGGFGN